MSGQRGNGPGQPQPADRCPVCGNELKDDEGVAVEWRGRALRFRCLGCLARFEADPDRYLSGQTDPCGLDEWDEANRATIHAGALAAWRAIANGVTPHRRHRNAAKRHPSGQR